LPRQSFVAQFTRRPGPGHPFGRQVAAGYTGPDRRLPPVECRMNRCLPLLAALLFPPTPAFAQQYFWREAESEAKADPAFQASGWGKSEYLSGGKWLFAAIDEKDVAAKVPAGGASVVFELPVEQFGKFELWARVGYEFARSPFRWRLDGGDWHDVKPGQFTTDRMA